VFAPMAAFGSLPASLHSPAFLADALASARFAPYLHFGLNALGSNESPMKSVSSESTASAVPLSSEVLLQRNSKGFYESSGNLLPVNNSSFLPIDSKSVSSDLDVTSKSNSFSLSSLLRP
jgi:hypothetical protein